MRKHGWATYLPSTRVAGEGTLLSRAKKIVVKKADRAAQCQLGRYVPFCRSFYEEVRIENRIRQIDFYPREPLPQGAEPLRHG